MNKGNYFYVKKNKNIQTILMLQDNFTVFFSFAVSVALDTLIRTILHLENYSIHTSIKSIIFAD